MKEIKKNDKILARKIEEKDWQDGLSFFSNDDEFIQVGAWSYNAGKDLLKHIHNEAERSINRTQEVLYVKKGRISAKIYSLEEEFVDLVEVTEGEVLILLNSGHGYTILEDNTQVLEIKNGPYLGADIDRKRF